MKKSANGRFQFKVNYHEGDIQRRRVDQQEGRIPKYIIKVEITDNRITEQLHTPLRIFTEYANRVSMTTIHVKIREILTMRDSILQSIPTRSKSGTTG